MNRNTRLQCTTCGEVENISSIYCMIHPSDPGIQSKDLPAVGSVHVCRCGRCGKKYLKGYDLNRNLVDRLIDAVERNGI